MATSTPAAAPAGGRIRIGISSCLLGENVRYNGGHKRERYITDVLSRYFEFVPYCPEVAIGLGVPRPTIRLQRSPRGARAILDEPTGRDVTDALAEYGASVAGAQGGRISGYIFKSRSPSCGLERVKVYDHNGVPAADGAGVYAAAIRAALPLLPVEEEGRLNDPGLRDSFIERVLVYDRWQALVAGGLSRAALIAFHTEHKFLLLAHDQRTARALGRRLAGLGPDLEAVAADYIHRVMTALSKPAGRGSQVNVLQHIAGFLKRALDRDDRAELVRAIDGYRHGELPIVVPLTLIRHHLRRHPDSYIQGQRFLEERPAALDTRRR